MTRRTSGRSLREIIILLRVALDDRYPGDPRLDNVTRGNRRVGRHETRSLSLFIWLASWRMRNAVGMGKATGSAGGAIRQKGGQGEEFQENEGSGGRFARNQEMGGNQEELPFMGIMSLKSEPDLDLGILGVRT